MTMNGVDVSSWQGNFHPENLPVDFCIVKATEGLGYVNGYCDMVVQRCIKAGLPWGFYHFARNNNATEEADYFIKNCRGYLGFGIPVLDWEADQPVEWVNEFVRRFHEKTGIWPWIYANPWRFNLGGVEPRCRRWISHYDKNQHTALDGSLPDIPKTDGVVCCWQFTSRGKVQGYEGDLDLDRFYGDRDAWRKYAAGDKTDDSVNPGDNPQVLENDRFRVTIEEK